MSLKSRIDWSKVNDPQRSFMAFPSRRSVTYGTKGVIACSQPLAAQAGLEVLRRGGNAADAAIATSAALNVTEPSMCGIGGDAFCLFYEAKTKKVHALNGSGRSPEKLTLDYALDRGLRGNIPRTDLNSVTVPGCAAAWVDTVEAFGSGKFSIKEVLQPAIQMAEEGVPVSELHSLGWQKSEQLIKDASPNGDEMLLNGKAPLPGQVMQFPNLAKTFRSVAEKGKSGFYEGPIAEAIVELIQSKGGVMELSDLAKHTSTFVDPIKYTYAGEVTVYECPPNGQGITALLALGILESLQEQEIIKPLLDMEHNSPEYLHALIEALRLGFADSQWFVSDPSTFMAPLEKLLDKSYLASRARLVDPTKTNPEYVHGNPANSSDTVYFTVSDQWGNACSFIQSNYSGFGTGAIPKGWGFTLQNRGTGFVLEKDHPNCLAGGKRPYHTIIPSLVTRPDANGEEELLMSFSVMGGYNQPQAQVQVLLNILRGFTPQAALDAPRFCIAPPPHLSTADPDKEEQNPPQTSLPNCEVYFEDLIPGETIKKLREMGHDARVLSGYERSMMGRGQIIQKLNSRKLVWAAGSDPRGDGHAIAQI